MHRANRARKIHDTRGARKVAVMSLFERYGKGWNDGYGERQNANRYAAR